MDDSGLGWQGLAAQQGGQCKKNEGAFTLDRATHIAPEKNRRCPRTQAGKLRTRAVQRILTKKFRIEVLACVGKVKIMQTQRWYEDF